MNIDTRDHFMMLCLDRDGKIVRMFVRGNEITTNKKGLKLCDKPVSVRKIEFVACSKLYGQDPPKGEPTTPPNTYEDPCHAFDGGQLVCYCSDCPEHPE